MTTGASRGSRPPDRPDLIIREATLKDRDALHHLMTMAFEAYAPALGFRPSPMGRDFSAWISGRFALVAVSGAEEIVGAAAVQPRPIVDGSDRATTHPLGDDYLYVDVLAVAPAWRGQGVGRALLSRVERVATELCLSRVRLHTPPALAGPIGFYRAQGFQLVARQGAGRTARLLFEKRISTVLDALLNLDRR